MYQLSFQIPVNASLLIFISPFFLHLLTMRHMQFTTFDWISLECPMHWISWQYPIGKAFTRQYSLAFPECFLALSYHFFSTSKGRILSSYGFTLIKRTYLLIKEAKYLIMMVMKFQFKCKNRKEIELNMKCKRQKSYYWS